MKKNKKLLIIFFILIVFFIVFIFANKKTDEQNSWINSNDEQTFWFPKNNIVVTQKIQNSEFLTFKGLPTFSLNQSNSSQIIEKFLLKPSNQITKKINELKKQKFTLNKDFTGLFGNKDIMNPYYLITYQKDNNYCQFIAILENNLNDKNFNLSGVNFGCANFNFDQAYNEQKEYYQILTKVIPDYKTDYFGAITDVQTNKLGYKLIRYRTWSDGNTTIIDKNDKLVCKGNPCCDNSSKGNKVLWNDKWCLFYQSIDVYKAKN